MTRLALALALCAAPAFAGQRMHLEPGDGQPCLWSVVIRNLNGWYQETETLETPRGPIRIHYETRGNHGPGQDDRAEVLEVPEGLTAYPWEMDLADDATGRVCVMEERGV